MSAVLRAESTNLVVGGVAGTGPNLLLRVRIRTPAADATKTIRFSTTVTVKEAIAAIAYVNRTVSATRALLLFSRGNLQTPHYAGRNIS